MTTSSPTLTVDAATDLIDRALRPDVPGRGSVGLEVEWIVVDLGDTGRPVGGDEVLSAAAGALPAGGTVGVEPGGQLELTTDRHVDAPAALTATDIDESALRDRLCRAGLGLVATGVDPFRPPRRSLDLPRYRAMEAAFDARGPAGRVMMCSTASLQVNVDFGSDPLATFERAGLVAPVLAAAFANSPRISPDGSTLASARSLVWSAIDPGRTRPVPARPAGSWSTYAFDADVLYIRSDGGTHPVGAPFPFRRWLAEGHRLGHPDEADVVEHLSTLFPPVRPRGWLECRFFDALAAHDRRIAVAALVALLSDDAPLDALSRACAHVDDPWPLVPSGLADPAMRQAAEACLTLAADLLDRSGPDGGGPVRAWAARRGAAGWAPPVIDLQSLHHLEQETR